MMSTPGPLLPDEPPASKTTAVFQAIANLEFQRMQDLAERDARAEVSDEFAAAVEKYKDLAENGTVSWEEFEALVRAYNDWCSSEECVARFM